MFEYRRGVSSKRKNDLWHLHSDCESFPTKTFAIRQGRPFDDDLCSRCVSLAGALRNRSAA